MYSAQCVTKYSDACRKTKLDNLPVDWMAYELAVLFTKWAQLNTDPLYAPMDFDAFKQHNIESLYFDTQRGAANTETQINQQRPCKV